MTSMTTARTLNMFVLAPLPTLFLTDPISLYSSSQKDNVLLPLLVNNFLESPLLLLSISLCVSLLTPFGRINDLCERLGVTKTVKDIACDIYSKVRPFIIEKRRENSLVASYVHIASQNNNQSRTLKEMGMEACVAEIKIVIANKSIVKVLNEKISTSSTSMELLGTTGTGQQVNDYLKSFAYEVGLNNQVVKAAQEILKKSEEHDIRTPKSVAAGIVYITCLLCGHKKTAKDISLVTYTS